MRQIYRKGEFIIIGNFIVINTKKEFKQGHTHLNNYYAAKRAIYLVRNHKIPSRCSKYFLVSLIRISNDRDYIRMVELALEKAIDGIAD